MLLFHPLLLSVEAHGERRSRPRRCRELRGWCTTRHVTCSMLGVGSGWWGSSCGYLHRLRRHHRTRPYRTHAKKSRRTSSISRGLVLVVCVWQARQRQSMVKLVTRLASGASLRGFRLSRSTCSTFTPLLQSFMVSNDASEPSTNHCSLLPSLLNPNPAFRTTHED